MQRPLTDENRCRPKSIHLRDNPEWEELLPHVEQLKIQVVVTENFMRGIGPLAVWPIT